MISAGSDEMIEPEFVFVFIAVRQGTRPNYIHSSSPSFAVVFLLVLYLGTGSSLSALLFES